MGNQTKEAKTTEEYHNGASCPLCRQTDSHQHWIMQCQASALPDARTQYIAQVKVDIRREEGAGYHKTVAWMKIVLDIAVCHPQRADVWVQIGSPTLRQALKADLREATQLKSTPPQTYQKEHSDTTEKHLMKCRRRWHRQYQNYRKRERRP